MKQFELWLCIGLVFSCGGKKEEVAPQTTSSDEIVAVQPTQPSANPPADASVPRDVSVDANSMDGRGADATSAQSPAKKLPAKSKTHSIAELAGRWHGTAVVPSYGSVIASVNLNKKGSGRFTVKVSGFTKSGSVQILSWNGRAIRAKAQGMQRSVPAKLSGNSLTLQLPIVGRVVVRRSKK